MTNLCRVCNEKKATLIFGVCLECTQLALDYAEKVASQCDCCGQKEDHYLHSPASACASCRAPQDHHEFIRRNEFVVD